MTRTTALLAALALVTPGGIHAQPQPDAAAAAATAARTTNLAVVASFTQRAMAANANDTNVLVRTGLIANRETRTVRFLAEATGLRPSEPVEFYAIDQHSGHDYEALLVSFAKPSELDAALRFIGVAPGAPVAGDELRMWPKGDRVHMSVEWVPDPEGHGPPIRSPIERMLFDDRTQAAPPVEGFLFVGSRRIPAPGEPSRMVYAADESDPRSIAASYNDPATVLDLPRRAAKGEEYGHIAPHAEHPMPADTLVTVLLTPWETEAGPYVADMTLRVEADDAGDSTNAAAPPLRFALHADGAGPDEPVTSFTNVLAVFEQTSDAGRAPYVVLDIAPSLTLDRVRDVCALIAPLEGPGGIRVEPPPAGQLYHKAFLPNEGFRDRAGRPSQPWELRIRRGEDGLTGELIYIEQVFEGNSFEPTLEPHPYPVNSAREAAATALRVEAELAREGIRLPPVVLIFAPDDLTYGELIDFVRPLVAKRSTVYIFTSRTSAPGPDSSSE